MLAEDEREQASALTVEGKRYALSREAAEPVVWRSEFYRAGLVGPDAFPDLIVGQSRIHPEVPGVSTTDQWLTHLFKKADEFCAARGGGTASQQREAYEVRAFTYGYLTHAAGDMWIHTLVNKYAKGVFPGAEEIKSDPAKALVAYRHLAVEGYITKRAPQPRAASVRVPKDFLRTTFIWNGQPSAERPCKAGVPFSRPVVPTQLAAGTHFDKLLKLRNDICDWKAAQEGRDCLEWDDVKCNPARAYARAWVQDIDRALLEWPAFSERLANAMFATPPAAPGASDPNPGMTKAKGEVGDFVLEYLLPALGVPELVAEGLDIAGEIAAWVVGQFPVPEELKELVQNTEEKALDWMFAKAIGLKYTDLKDYLEDPASKVNDTTIGLQPNTSALLDAEMGVTGVGTFTTAGFPEYRNTITSSKLALMAPDELNRLLSDLQVGPWYAASSPSYSRRNALLGFVRSLDGNDAWRKKGRDFSQPDAPYTKRFGDGAPVWVDCLGRARAFQKIFATSPTLSFGADAAGDACVSGKLDPLQPLDVMREIADGTTITRCTPAIAVRNNLDAAQAFTLYWRMVKPNLQCAAAGAPERVVVAHGVSSGNIAARATSRVSLALPCVTGTYAFDVFAFDAMNTLPAEDDRNYPVKLQAPVFGDPVEPRHFQIEPVRASCLAMMQVPPPGGVLHVGAPQVVGAAPAPVPPGIVPGDLAGGLGHRRCEAQNTTSPGDAQLCSDEGKLDLDGDAVADATDNCPAKANADQAQVCSAFSAAQLAKAKGLLKKIFEERLFGLAGPWGGPACPKCPPPPDPVVERALAAELASWSPSMPVDERQVRILSIAAGPQARSDTVQLASLGLDAEARSVTIGLADHATGALAVEFPRGLGSWTKAGVSIDGKKARATVEPSERGTVVEIDVPAGAKQLTISR